MKVTLYRYYFLLTMVAFRPHSWVCVQNCLRYGSLRTSLFSSSVCPLVAIAPLSKMMLIVSPASSRALLLLHHSIPPPSLSPPGRKEREEDGNVWSELSVIICTVVRYCLDCVSVYILFSISFRFDPSHTLIFLFSFFFLFSPLHILFLPSSFFDAR